MVALLASLGCLYKGDTESHDEDSDMVGGTGKGTRRENAHCVSVVFPSRNYDLSTQLSVLQHVICFGPTALKRLADYQPT